MFKWKHFECSSSRPWIFKSLVPFSLKAINNKISCWFFDIYDYILVPQEIMFYSLLYFHYVYSNMTASLRGQRVLIFIKCLNMFNSYVCYIPNRPCGKESTEVQITQSKGKKRENSY